MMHGCAHLNACRISIKDDAPRLSSEDLQQHWLGPKIVFGSMNGGGKAALKRAGHLLSKMRFLSAQFEAYLTDDLWLRCAGHANEMASLLAERVREVSGVTVTRPVQANAVFAALAPEAIASLQERYDFYVWDEPAGEVRWMCSWDTTREDVEGFAAAVADVAG